MTDNSQLDLECACLICGTYFTVHDIEHTGGKEIGSGWHISGMTCPNCGQKELDFDLIRVEAKYPIKDLIESRRKERGNRYIPRVPPS
jgi:hypothetical protein